jgi:hypothetical protein
MERDTTTLEAGTGDSPNPWSGSGDDDDNDIVGCSIVIPHWSWDFQFKLTAHDWSRILPVFLPNWPEFCPVLAGHSSEEFITNFLIDANEIQWKKMYLHVEWFFTFHFSSHSS